MLNNANLFLTAATKCSKKERGEYHIKTRSFAEIVERLQYTN